MYANILDYNPIIVYFAVLTPSTLCLTWQVLTLVRVHSPNVDLHINHFRKNIFKLKKIISLIRTPYLLGFKLTLFLLRQLLRKKNAYTSGLAVKCQIQPVLPKDKMPIEISHNFLSLPEPGGKVEENLKLKITHGKSSYLKCTSIVPECSCVCKPQ